MRHFLPFRSTLLLVFIASGVVAHASTPVSRSFYVSDSPREEVRPVHVAGGFITVLRFQQPCDRAGTTLLGWEGRFEPVECTGKKVLLEPLKNLEPGERFFLRVTLADGKEIPFTVMAHAERFDHQVNVFHDLEQPDAARQWMVRARALEDENARLRSEQVSSDHAFASLLAAGAVKSTPFRHESKWRLDLGGVAVDVHIYSAKKMKKAAVLFHVTNQGLREPWSLSEVQLSAVVGGGLSPEEPVRTGEKKAFALRTSREEIMPGESGWIAVVTDKRAFDSKDGPVSLVLELFRHDGLQQAVVYLDPQILTGERSR